MRIFIFLFAEIERIIFGYLIFICFGEKISEEK